MKKLMAKAGVGILTLLLGFTGLAGGQATNALRVVTFNIRFDNPKDSPNHWQARKDYVTSQLLFHQADLAGIQEALHNQVVDMQQAMPHFGFVGVGRDDGQQAGEYSGIFYNKQRLQLLKHNTFWLSLTPQVPGSKSWDAAITRIVTWAQFKDLKTKKTFFHFNTHFDHIGKEARRQSAKMLLEQIEAIAGNTPTLVTGDFNATPNDEPIQVIVEDTNPLRLTNAKAISATGHYGPAGTFNAFGPRETSNLPIDYIFVKGGWKVFSHATLSQTWQGRFASDHFAVFAEVAISR
ncbi:MAG TPA: endonuclease/exonuclease/phosphatase family protein [Phnomibacter sp.]|nr:endonuclease/exonuclease/phosphatase family protein [Phnomibacter sp.]